MQQVSKNKRRQDKRYGGDGNNGPVMTSLAAKKNNIPKSTEELDTSKNIIKWGKNNTYRYFLNYLFKNNPIHAGVIRSKRYYTVSGGLFYEGSDQEAWDVFFKNGKTSHHDKNLDELHWSSSLNFEKSNMFCYKIKINALKGAKSRIRKIEEVPFEKIGFGATKDEKGNVFLDGTIKVSNDWTDQTEKVQTLHPYDPKDPNQRMFYVLFKEESGQSIDEPNSKKVNPGYYPDPPYGGAITAIDTGIQINKFNNNETYNNFSLGNILNLNNGAPKGEEQREEAKRKIQKEAEGAKNAGSTLIFFNNGKDRAATIDSLDGNNLPDRYMNSKKGSEESTIHGHSVTSPILFGIKTEGSLGNATELKIAFEIMQATYFTARRAALLSVINWVATAIEGLQGEIFFNAPVLNLEDKVEEEDEVVDALNKMKKPLLLAVMESFTANEKRKLAKLPRKDGGDDLPNQNSNKSKFSEEDQETILSRFKEVGRDKGEVMQLFSTTLIDGTEVGNEAFLDEFNKSVFQNLSDNHMQVLNLINEGQNFDTIRKALDISGTDLAKIYKSLASQEFISDTGELLSEGAAEVAAADIEKLEVLFEYKLKATAPALLPGGESRDFCRTLIALNRVYTREEIAFISGVEGYDVFRYRGGWYHNPSSDQNEPGCRHEWSQIVVFKS